MFARISGLQDIDGPFGIRTVLSSLGLPVLGFFLRVGTLKLLEQNAAPEALVVSH